METPYHLLLKHWVFLVKKKKEKKKKIIIKSLVFSCTQKFVKQKCENDVLAPGFQKKGKEKNCC